jgi:hypothetical protein
LLRTTRLALFVTLMPLAAAAQTLSLGSLPQYVSSQNAGPGSIVDLSHPATANGTVNSFSIIASAATCPDVFRVRFLRQVPGGFGAFAIVADRGPFSAIGNTNIFTLNPAVTVQKGDLLAVTQTSAGTCSGLTYAQGNASDMVMLLDDLQNGSWLGGNLRAGVTPAMQASLNRDVLTDIIPVVGTVAGNFGSQFRTVIQLSNPTSATVNGKLVFHPINAAGSSSDPSTSFTLTARETELLHSTETIFGVPGVGSIDVITSGTAPPLIATRVFNDAGAAGTTGFAEDAVAVRDAIGVDQSAFIALPEDVTNFRMNVGVRTLSSGATLAITVNDRSGAPVASKVLTLGADLLRQMTVQDFTGTPATIDASIVVKVTAGSAIIYSTITDNRTNDSALKYASRR